MPPRSNFFQDVVAIIERHKAPDAVITDSAELVDRLTGDTREVDVTVASMVDGYETLVSVEASDPSRTAGVTWVEQLACKHQSLATTRLVLVSNSGFTGPALRKAKALGIVTITPEDLEDEDHEFTIISKLATPPLTVELGAVGLTLEVRPPAGYTMAPALPVYRANSTPVDTGRIADDLLDSHLEQVLVEVARDLTTTATRRLQIRARPAEALFGEARRADTGESVRVPVEAVVLEVDVEVRTHPEMAMVARLFDQTPALYGKTQIQGAEAIFVTTDHAGNHVATLRTREHGQRDPVDWELVETFEITPDET